jgi:hypothetical protein
MPQSRNRGGDALASLQEERSGFRQQKNGAILHRLVGYVPRHRSGTNAGSPVRGRSAAHQLLPALIQAEGEAPRGRQGDQALSSSGDTIERALAHAGLDETVKRRLREMYRVLDLVALLEQMREAQTETELGQRVD